MKTTTQVPRNGSEGQTVPQDETSRQEKPRERIAFITIEDECGAGLDHLRVSEQTAGMIENAAAKYGLEPLEWIRLIVFRAAVAERNKGIGAESFAEAAEVCLAASKLNRQECCAA